MNMKLVELTKENWKEQVNVLFSENGDYNGENGIDYANEETRAAGFDSNLEYAIDTAYKKHGSELQSLVEDVYKDFIFEEGEYYKNKEIQFLQIGDSLVAGLFLVD